MRALERVCLLASRIDRQGGDFATNHLVVLGHSMGGIMTHTLISDSGYKLWDRVMIVRYGHETFLHPDAVAEVKRILHAHLESL